MALGGDSPPRFSLAGEAESEKLPLPRSGHGAFRPVYLELETVRNEVRNILHYSLARAFTVDIDVAVVGISHKVVTTPLQLLVQFVQQVRPPSTRNRRIYNR
jgi:hypothetical protein